MEKFSFNSMNVDFQASIFRFLYLDIDASIRVSLILKIIDNDELIMF